MPTNSRDAWQLYFSLCKSKEDRSKAREHAVSKLKAKHIPAYRSVVWKIRNGGLSPKTMDTLQTIPFPVGTHWHPDIVDDDTTSSEDSDSDCDASSSQLFSSTPSSDKSKVRPRIPNPQPPKLRPVTPTGATSSTSVPFRSLSDTPACPRCLLTSCRQRNVSSNNLLLRSCWEAHWGVAA